MTVHMQLISLSDLRRKRKRRFNNSLKSFADFVTIFFMGSASALFVYCWSNNNWHSEAAQTALASAVICGVSAGVSKLAGDALEADKSASQAEALQQLIDGQQEIYQRIDDLFEQEESD